MKQKKIRGHKRRLKHIKQWRSDSLSIDLRDYLLNIRDRYYVKIRVHPWNGISLTNSKISEPFGKTKRHMLNTLIKIYHNWKVQLEQMEQDYYLKIWLFEPRFSQSQVVCAIGKNLSAYDNTFFKPEKVKTLQTKSYGELKALLDNFNTEYCIDEDHYDNTFVGEPEIYASAQDYADSKEWFDKLIKKPHRKTILDEPVGDYTEIYSFKRGEVWQMEQL